MKHGKQIIVLLLVLVLSLGISATAAASSTELTTTVPSKASLHVEVNGKGTVWVGSQGIRWRQTVSIQRNEQITIRLQPDIKNKVESILLDGTDITPKIKNNTFVLDITGTEHTLSVTFASSAVSYPKPDIPSIHHFWTPIVVWIKTVCHFFGCLH